MKKPILIVSLFLIALFGYLEFSKNPFIIELNGSTTQADFDDAIKMAQENGVSIKIDSVEYNELKQLTHVSGKASSLLSTIDFSTSGDIEKITIDKSRGQYLSSLSVKLEK